MEIDREEYMVEKYGECVTKTQAGRILSRDPSTIGAMIKDGRLDAVCGGTMVCVHSIARYIEKPREENFKARQRKAGRKWAVI